MSNYSEESRLPIHAHIHDAEVEGPRDEITDDDVPFLIAQATMAEYAPGVIIIGSPNLSKTQIDGVRYPDAVGIVLRGDLDITRSELASMLRIMADSLDMELAQLLKFVNEATNNE